MYDLIVYTTESGQAPLEKYINNLIKQNNQDDLAAIHAYMQRLSEHGMEVNNIHPHTIRNIGGGLYELRPQKHRVIFFYYTGNKFVLLHAFKKQHQKAPPNELKRAKKEMEDFIRRNGNG